MKIAYKLFNRYYLNRFNILAIIILDARIYMQRQE